MYTASRQKENTNFTNKMKNKVLKSLLKIFGDIKWIEHDETKDKPKIIPREELKKAIYLIIMIINIQMMNLKVLIKVFHLK